ncbi:hypothetical protein AB0K60_01065 [Thermopolyspora sp. NPDC052614]|uniref:hypothetical protein n=1 Tax=Thermopolyspora sp. NPDC052614 TaxID=3155682 RepID=UPI003440912F
MMGGGFSFGSVANGDTYADARLTDGLIQLGEWIGAHEQVGAFDSGCQWLIVPIVDEVTAPLAADQTRAVVVAEAVGGGRSRPPV